MTPGSGLEISYLYGNHGFSTSIDACGHACMGNTIYCYISYLILLAIVAT